MKTWSIKLVEVVMLCLIIRRVKSQCDPNADIYLVQNGNCYSNNTVFNENIIDDNPSNGVNCIKRGSTSTNGQWIQPNNIPLTCDTNRGPVQCQTEAGNVIIYTAMGFNNGHNGMYTCCIDNHCINARIYRESDYQDLFDSEAPPQIESCSVVEVSSLTVIPQTYIVQMTTSNIPPTRLTTSITYIGTDCNSQNSITCSTPYYRHLGNERYQYNMPVSWNPTDNSFTYHQLQCTANFENEQPVTSTTSIRAADTIPSVSYEEINATAIRVRWTYNGSYINGYIITITAIGVNIIKQINNNTVTSYVVEGIIPEKDYTIKVRGYFMLVGAAGSTTARLFSGTSDLNHTFLSPRTSFRTTVQLDAYTFRVTPTDSISWNINGNTITPSNPQNTTLMSKVLDAANKTYKYTLIINDILTTDIFVTFITFVNAIPHFRRYQLQAPDGPPTGISVNILSSSIISVKWQSPLEAAVNGYVVQYTGGSIEVMGGRTLYTELNGLTQGQTYQISVFAYIDVPSSLSTSITVLLDVPQQVLSLTSQPLNTTSISVSWSQPTDSIIHSYIVRYIRLCDGVMSDIITDTTSTVLTGLLPGLEYLITVQANNTIGIGRGQNTTTKPHGKLPSGSPNLQFSIVNTTSIHIWWSDIECTERNGDITSYSIQYYSNDNGDSGEIFISSSDQRSHILSGLTPFVTYNISIAGININGTGPYSTQSMVFTFSGRVDDFTATPDILSVQLTWVTPLSDRTDLIYIYEVVYLVYTSTLSCNDVSTTSLPAGYISYKNITTTTIEVTNLNENTCYIFAVRPYIITQPSVLGQWNIIATTTGSTGQSSGSTTPIIASVVVVLFLITIAIIIVIVVIIMVVRSRSKSKKYSSANIDNSQLSSVRYIPDKVDEKIVLNDYENVMPDINGYKISLESGTYTSIGDIIYSEPNDIVENANNSIVIIEESIDFDHQIIPKIPIAVTDLGHHVAECHLQVNKEFNEQFKQLDEDYSDKSKTIGFSEENKPLNRFRNITVYDDNHIILQALPQFDDCQRSFINASYIDGYHRPQQFIATQGPLKSTLIDYLRLIWQERTQVIVMLTNLREDCKNKCEQYWPHDVSDQLVIGPFKVMLVKEENLLDYVVRNLTIKLHGSSMLLSVKQYQYITWPDHGVPDSVSPFMNLHKQVTNTWSPSKGPILVHCSAGIGRTGTFIAVDIALEQASKEGIVDIAGIINRLREQRMKMVQTVDQYAFIHDAVLETVIVGNTEVSSDKLNAEVHKWRQPNNSTGITPLQTQFELLDQVTPNPDDILIKTAESFPEKNRRKSLLPYERWRVGLKNEYPDYIHASFVHGYRKKRAFIIAQSPMENTTRDFWKMIMDYKVSAIVMLCELEENGEETCYKYWEEDKMQYGEFTIVLKQQTQETGFMKREFVIINIKDESAHNMIQFQVLDWPDDSCVRQPQTLLQVIDGVIKVQQKIGGGPIVVHCSDTVSRCGVYCSLSIALEQCKAEGVIDVFQATKAVRMQRPSAVTTMDQYLSIYETVLAYIAMYSTYSNFNM